MEYKEYRYNKTTLLYLLTIASLLFILAFFLGFLERSLAFKVPGILSFLAGLYFIVKFIHAMSVTILTTTEDEIIFSQRPFAKPLHLLTKDIVKVEIQMNRLIWPSVLILHNYKDKIRKVKIVTEGLSQEDQIEFFNYLENLIKRKTSPVKDQ